MIKRINVLKDVGRFSVFSSTRGSQGDFSKLNVIYASNASGKSTICDVFRSLGTGNPAYVTGRKRLGSDNQPEIVVLLEGGQAARFLNGQWIDRDSCPPIHVYDDRFVAENVFIGHHISVDQRRNLYGLVMGDQAIALKQAVDTAEQQLNTATSSLNTAQMNLSRLVPTGYSQESFRGLAAINDVESKIIEATNDLRSAEQTKSKADAIRTRRPLVPLPVAEVPASLNTVLSATLDSAALAAEEKIKAHLSDTSHGLSINWLKQGFESQNDTTCPHCGQDMQGLDILEAYRSFFSGELHSQEQLREATKHAVETAFGGVAQSRLQQTITSHQTEKDWWKDAVGYEFSLQEIGDAEDVRTVLKDVYQALNSVLDRKRETPGSEVQLSAEESAAILSWVEKSDELRVYNEVLTSINAELLERQANAGEISLTPLQQRLTELNACKKRYVQGKRQTNPIYRR